MKLFFSYHKNGNVLLVILYVSIFILCGGGHCIADFALICLMKIPISFAIIKLILIDIIGNSIGAFVARTCEDKRQKM